jgi:hypothetical protein
MGETRLRASIRDLGDYGSDLESDYDDVSPPAVSASALSPSVAIASGRQRVRHPASSRTSGFSEPLADGIHGAEPACMPSQFHEALVELFRERPMLAAELVGSVFGVALPRDEGVEIVAASFGEVRPPEYSADLVLAVGSGEHRIAIILEVQLDAEPIDREAKRGAWLRYAVWQWADTRSPTYLVVVTPSRRVERWAGSPIAIGHPGFVLVPLVLGPSNVPVLNREQAQAIPELAVLSAVVHGHGKHAVEGALRAIEAALAIEPEKRKLYVDVVIAALKPGAQKQVEEMMMQKYEYQSEYARRYVQQGREEGKAEGREEGKAEGREQGKAEGRAEGVLRVLEARGLTVPRNVAERILACRDLETLDIWLTRAVAVPNAEAIFD